MVSCLRKVYEEAMERPENQFVYRLVTDYIFQSYGFYEESLRNPEADLRAPLVSNLISTTIACGTQYAEGKRLIDRSIRNLALKLIVLFGASWATAYCKELSLKDVSLNLLPNAVSISSTYFVFFRSLNN